MYYGKKVPYALRKDITLTEGCSLEHAFVNGKSNTSKGLDKIRDNIRALLNTRRGERFFNPEIGSNLLSYIFEPNDFVLRDALRIAVTDAITDYIEDVVVEEVNVTQYLDYVEIYVKYLCTAIGKVDEITLVKEKREVI